MKKAISITLNGVIFNIEEDAYEKLKEYLDSIKDYFESPEEEREILGDIESGIAEKFSAKLSSRKKVITIRDVEEVVRVMGTVGEIAEADSGGLPGEGTPKSAAAQPGRKLYRDSDNGIIAGVCSGIAAYFSIDPVFIRLLFIALVFAEGFGLLAYIVLWLVMPKAESNAQKLEMRGKPVNISKLSQAVKDKARQAGEGGREIMGRNRGWIYRLVNFPIAIIGSAVNLSKRILRRVWPAVSILVGISLVLAMFFTLLAITFALAVLIFNADSPYIHSDLPIRELTHSASYITVAISAYLALAIPLVFILLAGISFINRKSAFRLLPGASLSAIWMLAVIAGGVSAIDLAPRIKEQVDRVRNMETMVKSYEIKDFDSIRVGGSGTVKVVKGDGFEFRIKTVAEEYPGIRFEVKDRELIIDENRSERGVCIFCFDKPKEYEIAMPELGAFIAHGSIRAEIDDFGSDIRVNAGESSDVKVRMSGHKLESYIAGTNGRIHIDGSPAELKATLEGGGRLLAEQLDCAKIELYPYVFSRVNLGGRANEFTAELENSARLHAFDLAADTVNIRTVDYSRAEVRASTTLNAIADGHSEITYKGRPDKLNLNESGSADIKKSPELDFDELSGVRKNVVEVEDGLTTGSREEMRVIIGE